jgi:hypothetical protein
MVPVTKAIVVDKMKVVAPRAKIAKPTAANTPHATVPRMPTIHTAKHRRVLSRHMQEVTAVIMACKHNVR